MRNHIINRLQIGPSVLSPLPVKAHHTFEHNKLLTTSRNTGGSKKYYVGGYEVFIDDFNRIDEVDAQIGNSEALLKVSKIVESYPEIFG